MEIPSENSGSFIIHRQPFADASLEVMKTVADTQVYHVRF